MGGGKVMAGTVRSYILDRLIVGKGSDLRYILAFSEPFWIFLPVIL